MKDPVEVARVRKLLKSWDDGLITLGEFESWIQRETFKESVFSTIEEGRVHYTFCAGTFSGPQKHHYGLFDIAGSSQGFYKFSIKNIIRFYWNKLARRTNSLKDWVL